MKLLKDILYKVELIEIKGDTNIAISNICFNSKKTKKDSLFIALKGNILDGHDFISNSIQLGSISVVCEYYPKSINENITYVKVKNSTKALSIIASNFYNNPSDEIKLIGVTGTNGKTTVVNLLFDLFISFDYKVGLLSTIVNKINDNEYPSKYTTPDAIEINKMLRLMVDQKCKYCFMEVSSHAIKQNRVHALNFDLGLFTNISRDHLDYHKTFDDYILTKKRFFDDLSSSSVSIINCDDIHGKTMVYHSKSNVKTFAINSIADYHLKIMENSFDGLCLKIDNKDFYSSLIGEHNARNLLLTYAAAIELDQEPSRTLTNLSTLRNIDGRFQCLKLNKGIISIIDYAHTPDALTNVYKTIYKIKKNSAKLTTVIGCGGDRDKGKRSIMGKESCKWSDCVIFTSDNPRYENPEDIINDMKHNLNSKELNKVKVEQDRYQAILIGISNCRAGDVILIAGKGHEKFQESNGLKIPFSDYDVILNLNKS